MKENNFFNNKSILVTGGSGSIGSVLVKELLKNNPHVVRVLDNNETGLFELYHDLKSKKIRPLVGDVRDKERIKRAMEGIDIVFHAAALKHVPLCEYNPFDAVKTNIIGTQNIMDTALDKGVKKVILISTDKAANPTNVMGATKLLAEKLTISMNNYRGSRDTVFSCVRFGNVLNTRGSVIPLFKSQIIKGGPVTVTDPNMTRFMMTIEKAVNLVLKATEIATAGETFILKMPVVKIGDLAEVMVDNLAPIYGFKPKDIEIRNIGKRPGEKLYEELMTEYEAEYAYENEEMIVIIPEKFDEICNLEVILPNNFAKTSIKVYSSSDKSSHLLKTEEIKKMLMENIDVVN